MPETLKKAKPARAGSTGSARKAEPAKKTSKPAEKPKTTAKKASKPAEKPKATAKKAAEPRKKSAAPRKKPAANRAHANARGRKAAEKTPAKREAARPKRAAAPRRNAGDDLFLERREPPAPSGSGEPPRKGRALFGALNACLLIGIVTLLALAVRQQGQYRDFLQMRQVVDQQTFYEGTTVEGVDVSKMTLSNAMDYWRDRVEPRYANRAATLDNGMTVTAGELGYASDYAAVLSAAWSAGRNGSLEQRYRAVSARSQNPVAYAVTRRDYDDAQVKAFAGQVAQQTDRPAVDAAIESFDVENYEFHFTRSEKGRKLDAEALARDIEAAIAAGGGHVALALEDVPPELTTEEVASRYGLINYAITNASSSSSARLNNIALAMSMINGTRLAPGETFSFNKAVGERTRSRGFKKATAYSGGDVTEQVGGGICQVSTTLFNAAVKADMEIVERHNHSLTVSYVDRGKDATVDWDSQDFRFKNTSPDDVYICCYLTDDKRVRFGIFGRLLPNGETITVDAVTTEMIKYETVYEPTPLLPHGETQVTQKGRNGYKAEAYKVRWDADGNPLSRELLCRSVYQVKNEIVQYGA